MKSFQVKIPRIKGTTSESAVSSSFKNGSHAVEEKINREPLLDSSNQRKDNSNKQSKRQEKKVSESQVSAAEREAAERLDGRDIIRYMEQLGGALGQIAGEDEEDERPVKGRRGSGHCKERAVTPLKEKLLKSWGGSYLDRLDIVVGNGEGGQATESAPIFKPMFMQPSLAPPSEAQATNKPQIRKKDQKKDNLDAEKQEPAAVNDKKRPSGETRRLVTGKSKTVKGSMAPSPTANMPPPPPPPPPPAWVSSVVVADGKAHGASTGKKRGRVEGAHQGEDPSTAEGQELRVKISKLENQVKGLQKEKKALEDQFVTAFKEKEKEVQRVMTRVAEAEKEVRGMHKRMKEALKAADEIKRAFEILTWSLDV